MCDTKARLDGKVVVITGSSSGIGLGAAKDVARLGPKVILASRNKEKLKRAREEIINESGNQNIDYKLLDLASLKSVRAFANEIKAEGRLDVLINNAGAVGLPDVLTEDGLNLTMQVNFFGAFLLTYLLLPLLKSSSPSRIINGSASSMYIGEIDFNHWNDLRRYNIITSLANSKLAMTLFTAELSSRLDDGVTANAFDPFLVRGTNLSDNIPVVVKDVVNFFINITGRDIKEVGKEIAYLAAAPEMRKERGRYYKFCIKFINHWLSGDRNFGKRLWEESKRLVKITPEEDWELN
ncbi:hypothetical protein K1T71_009079 [Dendrolimus kikuchii]|uniref:Uncharacterized protein n=1 Tax=Dendrolimus kikuchii TaxID=765133 RepID=A0ACC1CTF0_9NEOP|nr:hypothetical protein K1T71_009079 [Dendrolimus kikuchii]